MKLNRLNRINSFYCFVIICFLYNTLQYLIQEGHGHIEIKILIVPFVGNCILLFCCLIHWVLEKFISSKKIRIVDWSFIIVNCLLFIWGLFEGLHNLFQIWIICFLVLMYLFL